ncbi:MAG: hypothetical protein Q8R44_12610 [Novosphingobium sp.]|nr:hypothetical protein [Novosphingobium sp.]
MTPLALAACATTRPPPSSGTSFAGFNRTAAVGPLRITPLTLIEDSRCPQGVRCVWAGQVRMSARIDGRGGIRTRELILGHPMSVGSGMLVLETVAPPPHRPGTTIPRSAYRFGFRYTANEMQR